MQTTEWRPSDVISDSNHSCLFGLVECVIQLVHGNLHVIYFALIALRGFLHQFINCLIARGRRCVVCGAVAASQRILLGLPRLEEEEERLLGKINVH